MAWVANRIRVCRRAPVAVAATTSLSQVFSCPVEMRASHDASAVSIAGTSFCTARPVFAGDVDPRRHCSCASSDRSPGQQIAPVPSTRSHLLNASTSARPASITIDSTR